MEIWKWMKMKCEKERIKNKNFLKPWLCACEGEINSFRKKGKRIKSERKGEYTIQKFTQKEKRVTSWEANKQTKSTTAKREQGRLHREWQRKDKIQFLVWGRGRGWCAGYTDTRSEGKHKEKKWRRVISTPLKQRKEEASNRNNASEPEKSIHHLPQADSFPNEPRRVSLEEVQWFLTRHSLLTPEKSLWGTKGTSLVVFHSKDKEKEIWKKLRKRGQPWWEKRENENERGWEGMKISMWGKLKRGKIRSNFYRALRRKEILQKA